MNIRTTIIEEARKWIGVRWRHQGRSIHGVDCVGLLVKVAQNCKLTDYDYVTYQRMPKRRMLLEYFTHAQCTEKQNREVGDILLLNMGPYPCHCAIYCGDTIIHAFAPRKQVIEEPLIEFYEKRLSYVYSFPGVI